MILQLNYVVMLSSNKFYYARIFLCKGNVFHGTEIKGSAHLCIYPRYLIVWKAIVRQWAYKEDHNAVT